VSGLVSYGGDPQVTVARSEIERITASLANVQTRLLDELQPMAQLNGLVHHLQLDAALPETLVRLGLQRHGCFVAAESYFSGDAQIAHRFSAIAEFLHDHPGLRRAIPKQTWLVIAGTVGLSAFSNNNVTAWSAGAVAGQLPMDSIGGLTKAIPESKIHVEERPPSAVYQTPTTLQGLASRLYSNGNIRVEAYQTETGRVVVAYLPGTAEWNPFANEKAFDLRSDVQLNADVEKSASYRAADAALNAFGVTGKDRVVVVGYSQGGMVGTELAQHRGNVVGLVTIGSPIANQSLPKDLNVISLEHSNDVVPALSGKTNPIEVNWATASRHVELLPGETILKAHQMDQYQETAALADQSTDTGLVRMKTRLLGLLDNAKQLEVREYEPLKGAS
jgi:hypothetical protein